MQSQHWCNKFAMQCTTFPFYQNPLTPKACMAILTMVWYILEDNVLVCFRLFKALLLYTHSNVYFNSIGTCTHFTSANLGTLTVEKGKKMLLYFVRVYVSRSEKTAL